MFEDLSGKLASLFKKLKGLGKLSEKDVSDGLRHVRMALLEADVNYRVAKKFISDVKDRALGHEVMSSLTPGQQILKIVVEEMTELMGGVRQELHFTGVIPTSIMLIGLQGSGKTTTAGKLAVHLRQKGRKPYLVSLDVYRPAAMDQLKILAEQIGVNFFDSNPSMSPMDICRDSRVMATKSGSDTLILDTAGRLHIYERLMIELVDIKTLVKPSDVLLVADAMTGQDAVNIAKTFDNELDFNGIVLTKMDGDARGGAALSMKSVTGKAIKFIGVGEKLRDIEPFYPDRLASRILGMGDIQTVIDKANMAISEEAAAKLEKKIRKNNFSLEDFKEQMVSIRKMGSFTDILGMIPGLGKMKQIKNLKVDDKEFVRVEAIINSMTIRERRDHSILNGSRRKRIARGSGTRVQDVNRLLKNYNQVMRVMKKFNRGGVHGLGRGMLPF